MIKHKPQSIGVLFVKYTLLLWMSVYCISIDIVTSYPGIIKSTNLLQYQISVYLASVRKLSHSEEVRQDRPFT